MRRVILMLAATALIVAMMAVSAAPSFASAAGGTNHNSGFVQTPSGQVNCHQHNAFPAPQCFSTGGPT